MKNLFKDPVALIEKLLAAALLVALLYVLTAPPLMKAMTRHNPRGEWPWIYRPLMAGFWCDWTRPVFSWYFDRLWQADTELLGE
jgi:hypothetical protein